MWLVCGSSSDSYETASSESLHRDAAGRLHIDLEIVASDLDSTLFLRRQFQASVRQSDRQVR